MYEVRNRKTARVRLPVRVTAAILVLVYQPSVVVASSAQTGRIAGREARPIFTSLDVIHRVLYPSVDLIGQCRQEIGDPCDLAGAGSAVGLVEGRAQSTSAETLSQPTLPANTPVVLRLTKNLYKKDAKPGEPMEFEVGFDVVLNGQVIIQSGDPVTGSFRRIDHTGKGPAKVLIDLGPTQTVSGETVRLAPTRTTKTGNQIGVSDAVLVAGETGPLFPAIMPVLVIMTLFEKKVILDKDAGETWFGCFGCGVWVVAHVAENVALNAEKLETARAQYTSKQRAAEIALCQALQSRNPEISPDENVFWGPLLAYRPQFNAQLLQQAGDLDAAIGVYQQALAQKLDCPGVPERAAASSAPLHSGLAELLREKRDFVHAVAEYRTAVQLDPDGEHTREGFATFLVESDDPDAALAEIKEAMRIWPDNIYFHYLLGKTLVKKNDPDGAIMELQSVLKRERNHDWKASCALGSAYEMKGDIKPALGQYRTALRSHEGDKECHAAYERLQLQLKK